MKSLKKLYKLTLYFPWIYLIFIYDILAIVYLWSTHDPAKKYAVGIAVGLIMNIQYFINWRFNFKLIKRHELASQEESLAGTKKLPED
jgi:hypothetical protein